MLKQGLEGKTIAVVGYQTLTGRLILRKIIDLLDNIPFIFAVEIGKDETLRSKFINDPYFTARQREVLSTRVVYVALEQLATKLT